MVKSVFKKAAFVAVTLINLCVLDVFATHDSGHPFFPDPPRPVRTRPPRPFPGGDFDVRRPPFRPPPHPVDFGCYNQSVNLICKVDGDRLWVSGYTDCGYTPNGAFCNFVETPGYVQRRMRVQYQCRNGEMIWMLGNDGACVVSSF